MLQSELTATFVKYSNEVAPQEVKTFANVFITDQVRRVNTDLHLKLENLFNTTQKLFSNLYEEVEKVSDQEVKMSILETIWQIHTLIEVQKENLSYKDFEAVEHLVFELTKKSA